MAIDWKMFPMKIHYFLRFAGVGPLMPYLPVIVRQKGIPVHYVGVIWTLLSAFSLVFKATTGPLADYLRAHRAVMAGSIFLMTMALTTIYWIPDLSTYHGEVHGKQSLADHQTVHDFLVQPGFWVLFTCLLFQFCCSSASGILQEALCYQLLGSDNRNFGKQRLWGSLGWGIGAVSGGLLVDWYSQGKLQKDYLPAYVMTFALLSMDVAVVSGLKFSASSSKLTFSAVFSVISKPSTLLILFAIAVGGGSCAMVDTFQFMLVEDLMGSDYAFLKILEGLMMGVQCLLSEIPFFFVMGEIIDRLGYFNSFMASLMFFGLRFFLLATIDNAWWFLLVQLFHGPSFCLVYTAATSYASVIAPSGTEATMQAIVGIAYFGGGGVGSFIGGNLFHQMGGKSAFMSVGVFCVSSAILFHLVEILLKKATSEGQAYHPLKATGR